MSKKKKKPSVKSSRTKRSSSVGQISSIEHLGIIDQMLIPEIPKELSILPIRGTVMFPGTVMPLGVGRSSSLAMLDATLPQGKIIGLVTQIDEENQQPGPGDLYGVGTAAMVLKSIKQADGTVSLIVHGLQRFVIKRFRQTRPFLKVSIELVRETIKKNKKFEAAVKNIRETAMELIMLSPSAPEQAQVVVMNIEGPGQLADFLAANLNIDVEERQDLLEQLDVSKRIRAVQLCVTRQLEIARLQQKINDDVQSTITDSQRRHYLREQMRAIQKELGIDENGTTEQIEQLREKLKKADPPEKVITEAERELKRLEVIPTASPEYSVILTYLETVAELPWRASSKDNLNLDRAQLILDEDHYDLMKVKRRLIEYLAVRKLNPTGRGPILCFVGPPGVGKTSLGESIARALGRSFARMSFGGITDEAEIRGHRRTYIGSMPGRIIQELRRAGTNNPVMMLDEIDKLGSDFRGDPASALLEVLDSRQNHAFVDRYLDVPFDLSQVLFIATANYIDPVPPALRDRMEVIEIPGYTDNEKVQIARRYLVPRQMEENGLTKKKIRFTVSSIRRIIDAYTREAGVRNLERQIGGVCRDIAARVARQKQRKIAVIEPSRIDEILGPQLYMREKLLKITRPGIVTGLAYTPQGGEVLFIEATRYAGKGEVRLTGQIGDIMKESAYAAMSLLKSKASSIGIDDKVFESTDVHIHVPAGAIPKDGPSAGIGMFMALASLFLDSPVNRSTAMTGEITLRGLVLPIGGLKEKALAAARAGINTVIAPKHNEKDLSEIADDVKKKIKFVFVETIDDVLNASMKPRRR